MGAPNKGPEDAIRSGINIQLKSITEIIEETLAKRPEKVADMYAVLSDWIDLRIALSGLDKNVYLNMLSLTHFEHFWRTYWWIFFEILSGAYFEALRDLRFVFESALRTVHYDFYIDSIVLEKHDRLSHLSFKVFMLDIIERFMNRIRAKYEDLHDEELRREAEEFVEEILDELKSVEGDLEEVKAVTCEILSQEDLYVGTSKLIDLICREMNLGKKVKRYLMSIWGELSSYVHFSSRFVRRVLESDMQLVMLCFDEELFDFCTKMALRVFDVVCGAIVLLFHKKCGEAVKGVIDRRKKADTEMVFTEAIFSVIRDESV